MQCFQGIEDLSELKREIKEPIQTIQNYAII